MATNGVPTPPSGPTPELTPAAHETSDNKRKRDDDIGPDVTSSLGRSRGAQLQKDILEILEQYDIFFDSERAMANFSQA